MARLRGQLFLRFHPRSKGSRLHHHRLRAHQRVALAAELRADDRVGAQPLWRDHHVRRDTGDEVLFLSELRHPERVDHVLAVHLQLDGLAERQAQLRDSQAFVLRIAECPGELLGQHVHLQVLLRNVAILGERDRADDGDRGHEHSRHRRPGDLEGGVAVNRSAVGVVVGTRPETDDRIEDHGNDEREDGDADPGHEPEDEVDSVGLLRGRRRQPGNEKSHRRRDCGDGEPDCDQAHEHSPAHEREPTESAGETPVANKRHKPFTKGCFLLERAGYPARCGPRRQTGPERRTTWESE